MLEGLLGIDLHCRGNRVQHVDIQSSRPFQAQRLLHGKSVETVLSNLPLMYNVCAHAQASAGVQACRQALGTDAAPGVARAQQLLVDLESVREHLWRMSVDWPQILDEGISSQAALLSRVLKQTRQALFGDANAFALNARLRLDADALHDQLQGVEWFIDEQVLAAPQRAWLEQTTTVEALATWSQQQGTVAARLLWTVAQRDWVALGNVESRYLPILDDDQLIQRFNAQDVLSFIATPRWQGASFETTALGRQRETPLVKDLLARHGSGLLTRLAAKLVEVITLFQQIRRHGEALLQGEPDTPADAIARSTGEGIGQVEAARGRLVHWVKLNDGAVEGYHILAPTEWNFQPDGVAVTGLKHLQFGDEQELRLKARCWLDAIDPCVAYELRVH